MDPDLLLTLPFRIGGTLLAGIVTFLLARRDVGGQGTALATAGCVVLMGAGSVFSPLLPFFIFIVAAAVYLVLRQRIRVDVALAVSAVVLAGGLVGCTQSNILLMVTFPIGSAVFAGLLAYLLVRRDFSVRVAMLATVICVILAGVSAWFSPFLTVFPIAGAALVYLVMRRLVRVGPALAISAVILIGGLAGSELAMIALLNSMG